MLNGVSPVIVFYFAEKESIEDYKLFGYSIPVPSIPIPIYLDEEKTGIYLDDSTKSFDVDIEQDENDDYERSLGSETKISLVTTTENIVAVALLAMFEKVMKYVGTSSYEIGLFANRIFLPRASLVNVTESTVSGTNKLQIDITLSTKSEKKQAESLTLANTAKAIADKIPSAGV